MTTYPQAVDDIFTLFRNAWLAGSGAIVGSVPLVLWQGVESRDVPPANAFWCRVSTQQVLEEQAAFRIGVAPDEKRRYTSSGLVLVQLFCPLADAQAMARGRQLAVVARDAFRGQESPNGVWFRNARINELPPETDYYRFNIIVEYEYDDFG